jgi:hypothetical protein
MSKINIQALLVAMLAVAVCCAVWASFWSAAASLSVAALLVISWRSDWTPFSVKARKDDD